jgi:hypothetical protein
MKNITGDRWGTKRLEKKKALKAKRSKCLFLLVRQAGFEPATYGLEVRCSIQLSYWRFFMFLFFSKYKHSTISDDIILKVHQKATSFLPSPQIPLF